MSNGHSRRKPQPPPPSGKPAGDGVQRPRLPKPGRGYTLFKAWLRRLREPK